MSATISTAHLNNKRHSPQSLFTTRWDLPVNNNETPSPNYNDSLISLKANLDRLSFQRTLTTNPNRQSRESGLGSSVGGREEEFPTQYNSDIRGLLDQLDTCWNKVQQQNLRIPTTIDRPHPANDVAASNISIRERPSIESAINYGHSKSSTLSNPFKKLGHRRHRIINPPVASPHSSSSSVISLDPNTSYPTNPPASSSGQTLGELKESSSISGWLVKLYVINPSLLARKQWKRRYFCLHDNVLYRFKSSCSSSLPTDKMTIDPESIICVSDGFSGKKRVFQVKTGEECWFLQAETTVQLKSWLQGLKSIHVNPINTHNSYENSTVASVNPPKLVRSKFSSSGSMRSFRPNGVSDSHSIIEGKETSMRPTQIPDFSRLSHRRGSEDESLYQLQAVSPSEPTTPTSPPSSIRYPSSQFKSTLKKNQFLTPVMELQDDNESILEMFSSFGKKNHSSHSLNWKVFAQSNPTPA